METLYSVQCFYCLTQIENKSNKNKNENLDDRIQISWVMVVALYAFNVYIDSLSLFCWSFLLYSNIKYLYFYCNRYPSHMLYSLSTPLSHFFFHSILMYLSTLICALYSLQHNKQFNQFCVESFSIIAFILFLYFFLLCFIKQKIGEKQQKENNSCFSPFHNSINQKRNSLEKK